MDVSDPLATPPFNGDAEARTFLEGLMWPSGPVCPHCGSSGRAYGTKRAGLWRCAAPTCRRDFTVTTGTAMERSHVALHLWLRAFHLMAASRKGVSAIQLQRTLGVSYSSAWSMVRRIRASMEAGGIVPIDGETSEEEKENSRVSRSIASPSQVPRPYAAGFPGSSMMEVAPFRDVEATIHLT